MTIILHAEKPRGNRNLMAYMGYEDGIVCRCGNDTSGAGFITLNADNTPTDLRAESKDLGGRVTCAECGRVYHDQPHDGTHQPVRLSGDRFPAEPAIHFWVDYSDTLGRFGLYITTLADDDLDLVVARHNVLNG